MQRERPLGRSRCAVYFLQMRYIFSFGKLLIGELRAISLNRQLHQNGGAPVRALRHPDGAAVELGNLPHQREAQPRTAVLPAAGLIHPEEGLEDAALKFLRDAAAGV